MDIVTIILGVALVAVAFFTYRQHLLVENLHKQLLRKSQLESELREKIATGVRETAALRARQDDTDTTTAELVAQITEKDKLIFELQQEIAEQKKTAAQSHALFSVISNAAYDIVLVLDENCDIITYNKSAQELFKDKNPIGDNLTNTLEAPDLESIVRSALENNEEFLEEQIIIQNRMYRVRTQLMRFDDALFIGVALHDITQLVRLNRARRDMVANISHELRTPIANIRLTIDSLFHDVDKPKRKESIASLRDIARETDTLLWLVQELLDLSMIESGQAIMKMVENPLTDVADEALARLEDQLNAKKITIVRHIPEKLTVLCDIDQTKRVLMNLVHNAMKWSPKGETITIEATSDDEEITITVLDNGPGVPDDQVSRIFERFYQVDASRSGNEGTGLGLAICRHIVEAQGGRIWAEGNGGSSGGRFSFTLLKGDSEVDVEANPQQLTSF